MSFRTVTYWCRRCQAGTPHEYDDYTQKSNCITCAEKDSRPPTPPRPSYTNEPSMSAARCMSALDGMGNRGELPRKRRDK